jgi:phenylacetate-CoA ligase
MEAIKTLVRHAYENVPYYRKLFRSIDLRPADISSANDLRKIPILTKEVVQKNYRDFIGTKNIARVHRTTGTSGKPLYIFYDMRDFDGYLIAKASALLKKFVGITKNDRIVNTFAYGLVQAGLEYDLAASKTGAMVIPTGTGLMAGHGKTLDAIVEFRPTALFATPSYALRLGEIVEDSKLSPRKMKIERAMITGEPLTEAARERIEEIWGAEVYNVWGMTEIGAGAGECSEHSGLHVMSDYIIPEVFRDGETCQDGEGELVVTTVGRYSMPLIRYNTRDIVKLSTKKCACGSGYPRVTFCGVRSDNMLKIKGSPVYPVQIEQALYEIPQIGDYRIVLKSGKYRDYIAVEAETRKEVSDIKKIKTDAEDGVAKKCGVKVNVKILKPGSLKKPDEWKTQKFFDLRRRSV